MIKAGLGGIVILGAALYFSGAGSWLWPRVEKMDAACYGLLADLGTTTGSSICGAMTQGVAALNDAGSRVGAVVQDVVAWVSGSANALDGFGTKVSENIAAIASPSATLSQMVQRGPASLGGVGGGLQQQFQQAVDSFTIGQGLLGSGNNAEQAVQWLRQGAAQPQGYGLLSQLSLSELYRTGGHGIQANPAFSNHYLQQARDSLTQLTASGTPQAQQILQALPTDPQAMQAQINTALQQIQTAR